MTSPRRIHHNRYKGNPHGDRSRRHSSFDSNHAGLSIGSRDVIVAGQWVVLGRIGEGSFGEIFEVRDINTHRHYAIKRERRKENGGSQLKHENVMYDVLAGGDGIPQCHWYGHFDGFTCIVMDLLGPSLGQLAQSVSCMELDIATDLVSQMVSIVEHIHSRGVILRDVKPENFVFGAHLPPLYNDGVKPTCKQVFEDYWCTNDPKLYAIDFGLTCYWRDPHTGVAYSDSKKHIRDKTGTARYASIQVHRGNLPSRRDDLESIGYILLDLVLGGRLPWAGVHAKNSKAGWDKVWRVKVDTPLSELCAGLPQAVVDFIAYTRSLRFMDQPDYDRLRGFLHAAAAGPDHYNQPDQIVTNPPPLSNEMDDDHYELFAMDDMKHHLPTVPEVPKKVGWNTHKRLDMADWTND